MRTKENTATSNLFGRATKLAAVGLFILVLLSVTRGVVRLSSSGTRVREAQEKLEEVRSEQETLKRELEKVQSEYYREQQTRDKLGMAKEGEIVVVLPEESVLRRLSPRRAETDIASFAVPNWQKWAKLFFEI